jgi:hypothetical protein
MVVGTCRLPVLFARQLHWPLGTNGDRGTLRGAHRDPRGERWSVAWFVGVPRPVQLVSTVIEARRPLGLRHRWSLWTDGPWPCPRNRFPGEAALWKPPFAGVSAGSGPPSRGPYAAACQCHQGHPVQEHLRGGPALRGLVGANGWSLVALPVRRGMPATAGCLVHPVHLANPAPPGV